MLVFKCPYCGVEADETELNPGGEAHLKRFGPGSSEEEQDHSGNQGGSRCQTFVRDVRVRSARISNISL